MATSINDIRKRFVAANINEQAADSLYDVRDTIRELQVDQLRHGKTKKGDPIGKYKNKAYAKMKNKMNPLPGLNNMDWILTGELSKEIFVDVRSDTFVIDSADPKAGPLIKAHGDPFGLSQDSRVELIPVLRPAFVKRMKEKLRL